MIDPFLQQNEEYVNEFQSIPNEYFDFQGEKEEEEEETVFGRAKGDKKNNTRLLKEDVAEYMRSLRKPPEGLFTGFADFDRRHGRIYEPGHLIVEAARPGGGKTVFAMQQAEYHAAAGLNVLVWSLEMTRMQLIQRSISKRSGISVKNLKNRIITQEDAAKLQLAADYVYKLPLYCNDISGASSNYIRNETIALHNKLLSKPSGKGLAFIVVDYTQLATPDEDHKTREREVAAVTEMLMILAKELNVPILALAQLNREVDKRSNKRPILSDLGESGSLERHAHTIMFLYRESMYCDACIAGNCREGHKHKAEIIIAKNRDGESGSTQLFFSGERMLFADADYSDLISEAATRKAAEAEKTASEKRDAEQAKKAAATKVNNIQTTTRSALRSRIFGGSNARK